MTTLMTAQREMEEAPSERIFSEHVESHFSAGRRPDTSSSQDAGMVPVALSGILDEEREAGKQPRPVKIENLWAIVS